tara:strand:- start:17 stop:985 length:969 start_codon:yes stop_codon:yes gene_type:complete
MIYLFLLGLLVIYLIILSKNRDASDDSKSSRLKITFVLVLSLFTLYIFSLSYDFTNTAKYKEIHTKNLSVRSNIRTIKENIPKLEARLLNSSNDFNGWLMLGKSYSIIKNYQKASKAYQVAINLSPDNMDALREYILVLRSDSEIINKDLIEKYLSVYFNKTDDPQALLDLLSFSFNVNDNSLAQTTLTKIIKHPDIANKKEYKKLLTDLVNNSNNNRTILHLSVSSKKMYEGYFFMILKEKNINQPFAIKRVSVTSDNFEVKFTTDDFMIKSNVDIPDNFEFVIKHSQSDRFTSDSRPTEVFRMDINNYKETRDIKLQVTF